MSVSKTLFRAAFALAAVSAAASASGADAWRDREIARLAARTDRDSLIAAVLLDPANPAPARAARERLARDHGTDVLAATALAWACQRDAACDRQTGGAYAKVAPDDALAYLILPAGAAPDAAQLHAAAGAKYADSRIGAVLGVVRAALPATDDASREQRRAAVEAVPLPVFAGVVTLCKAPAQAALKADCLAVGKLLAADRSGAILVRMIGSVLVRRAAPGTPDAAAALALRRDYVWMGEVLANATPAERDRLQADIVELGEWTATQHAAQRATGRTAPPADWAPKDPNLLRLPEERTPPSSP
jgi:hypothetical protein